ncbi:MAG: hypothetical protein V3R87_10530 [Dehalococcoidia bacterium]
MVRKPSFVSRPRRPRKDADSSPEHDGEDASAPGRRASFSLRGIGRSIAASLDSGVDDLDDDPIGVFLEAQEAGPDRDQPEIQEPAGLVDILAPPPDAAAQDPIAEAPPPAQVPAPGPPDLEPGSFAAMPPELGLASTPAPTPPPAPMPQEAPVPPQPSADAAPHAPPASQAEAPMPTPDENMGITAVTDSQPVPLESEQSPPPPASAPPTAGPPPDTADPLPIADFAPTTSFDSTGADAGAPPSDPPAMTAIESGPVSFALDDPDSDEEDSDDKESTQGGDSGSDSLLDLFRSEEIEENPLAGLAKGLPKVDMQSLVEKVNKLAAEIKGEPENPVEPEGVAGAEGVAGVEDPGA